MFQKLYVRYDSLNYFSTVLQDINEVSLHVVYIVYEIIILFYRLLYILLEVTSSFRILSGF